MTNENAVKENALLTKPVEYMVNGESLKLSGNMVKSYLVRGNGAVTDQEIAMFLNLCKYQKLNPFLNEAYLIKFGSQPAQIITSKEAFLKRAENHPKYEGFEAGIIVERDGGMVEIEGAVMLSKDVLIGGWAKVYRSDRKLPVTSRISFKEFSKGQATWKDMPLNMIRKSAIVNAQREAFPDALGALFTEEEAPNAAQSEDVSIAQEIQQNANTEIIDIKPEPIKEKPQQKEEIIDATYENVQQQDIFTHPNTEENDRGF